MNVEYLNPVISATTYVLRQMCKIEIKTGSPYLTQINYDEKIFIVMIGITGDLQGQVILGMRLPIALDIASKMMMGMEVNELNDLAKSAIGELINMIMGNAVTDFFNMDVKLDITPPAFFLSNSLSMSVNQSKMICIPITYESDKIIELNIAIKDKE